MKQPMQEAYFLINRKDLRQSFCQRRSSFFLKKNKHIFMYTRNPRHCLKVAYNILKDVWYLSLSMKKYSLWKNRIAYAEMQ